MFRCSLIHSAEVILADLLASFRFSPAAKDIYWNMESVSYPTIGKDSNKPSLPMKVEPLAGISV